MPQATELPGTTANPAASSSSLGLPAATWETALRAAMGAGPIGVLVTDKSGTIVGAEGSVVARLFAGAATVGARFEDVISGRREETESYRRALLGETSSVSVERAGQTFDCRFTPAPAGGVVVVAFNITELARTTASLRQLVKAVETMQIGVTITDLAGTILYTNPADASMHGHKVEELIGQDVLVFSPGATRKAMSLDDARRIKSWIREGWNRRADGSLFPVRLRSDVVTDAGGTPVGIVTTCEDVSESRRAEQALKASEVRYRAIVENAAYGIYRSNADGRFVAVNPALVHMLGYASEDEVLELDVPRAVFVDPHARARLIERFWDTERVEGFELDWYRKDGSIMTARLSGRVVRAEAGAFDGFEMIVEDVTERRHLEEQLRQAQKMEVVGQVTGGMAHDFNNILTVIQSNADLIGTTLPDSLGQMRSDLDEIRAAAQRGSAMVRKLLAFSRHDRLAPAPMDMVHLVEEQVRVLGRLIPKDIDIQWTADPEIPVVSADAGAVEQILFNLATNARDAMPGGGILRIEVGRGWLDEDFRALHGWGDPGEYITVAVSDTGVGMDMATRNRVFEPFFTTKLPGAGTGLGMAMVYGLMKQHGGYVNVYSELNQGTMVKLFFPVAQELSLHQGKTTEKIELPRGTERVLLVEDELPIQRAAKRLLERYGYTVIAASDGEEALATFTARESQIDLIVSDIMMPRLNGRALYDKVRKINKTVPFLFTSGYTAPDVRARSNFESDVPFLQKPWTLTDLVVRIREVLDARRS